MMVSEVKKEEVMGNMVKGHVFILFYFRPRPKKHRAGGGCCVSAGTGSRPYNSVALCAVLWYCIYRAVLCSRTVAGRNYYYCQ